MTTSSCLANGTVIDAAAAYAYTGTCGNNTCATAQPTYTCETRNVTY